jgi:cyclohexanecarboxylate-CoA ligase
LIHRAASELNLRVVSVWGMTESLANTMTEPERAFEKSATTDGRALDGNEVKVVDAAGNSAPAGTVGKLMVRGAQNLLGYYKRPDITLFDSEGWMDTGDLACVDGEGYIRIAGRTKDIIIRGGENVPVTDIENVLYEHPSVQSVALIGYPDARLGERACAFVQLRPGRHFDFTEMQAHLAARKVTKQFWPERLEILELLPRTPSGKIQKFALRDQAKVFGDEC